MYFWILNYIEKNINYKDFFCLVIGFSFYQRHLTSYWWAITFKIFNWFRNWCNLWMPVWHLSKFNLKLSYTTNTVNAQKLIRCDDQCYMVVINSCPDYYWRPSCSYICFSKNYYCSRIKLWLLFSKITDCILASYKTMTSSL